MRSLEDYLNKDWKSYKLIPDVQVAIGQIWIYNRNHVPSQWTEIHEIIKVTELIILTRFYLGKEETILTAEYSRSDSDVFSSSFGCIDRNAIYIINPKSRFELIEES